MSDSSSPPNEPEAEPQIERDPPGHDLMVSLFERWRAHKLKLAAKTKAARKYDGAPNTLIYRSGRLVLDFVGELLTIILGIIFIWFNLLFFFLQSETVELSPFKGTAQSILSDRFNGQSADLQSLRVKWFRDEQALGFVAQDLTIFDKNGAPITTAKTMDAKFGLRSLIFGNPVLTEATLEGGSLTVIRSENGTVTVGLGEPENAEAYSRDLNTVQDASANAPTGATRKWRSISTMQLRGGQIYLIDEIEKINWRLDSVNLDYINQYNTITLDLTSDIVSNGQITPLSLSAVCSDDLSDFDIRLRTAEFYPAKLLSSEGRFSVIGALDAPVELIADIKATDLGLNVAEVDFFAGKGRIKAGETWRGFNVAKFKVSYDAASESLRLSDLNIDSEFVALKGSASLRNFGDPKAGFFNKPVSFDADLKPVMLDLGDRFPQKVRFVSAAAKGKYDSRDKRLSLANVKANFGDYAGDFKGNIGFGEDGKILKDITLNGNLSGNIVPQTILNFWPFDFALGARDWIKRSLLAADIPRIDVDLSFDEENFDTGVLDNEDLRVSFDYFNSNVKYISTMTPLDGASGSAIMEGNRFELFANEGRIGPGVNLSSARVDIPRLNPKGGDLNIEFSASGPAADLLGLVDEEPFRFLTKANLDPRAFTGAGNVDVKITRPLLENFDRSLIRYSAKGQFSKISTPIKIGDYNITDADVTLEVDNDKMSIAGPVSIGAWQAQMSYLDLFDEGVTSTQYTVTGRLTRDDIDKFGIGQRAFFDGAVDLSINAEGEGGNIRTANLRADLTPSSLSLGEVWRKDSGELGTLTANIALTDDAIALNGVQVASEGVSLSGDVKLAKDFRLTSMNFPVVQVDRVVDGQLTGQNDDQGGLRLDLNATFLDVSPWMKQLTDFGRDGERLPVMLTAAVDSLKLSTDTSLTGAVLTYRGDDAGMVALSLLGDLNGQMTSAEVTTPIAGGRRTLDLTLPNAGEAFRALYNFRSLEGGTLTVAATLPPTGEPGPITGTARLEEFKLVNAPIFAQILSLASLQGLSDALDGRGMNFKEFQAPFTYEQSILSVSEARMGGSALGLTANGDIDFADQSMTMNGVLVPSYTLNSMLGEIPLLGDIIVGKKGEGIFALNYSVNGPFDKTQIAVNPLSAFTPGFLRRIFDPAPKDEPAEDEPISPQAPEEPQP